MRDRGESLSMVERLERLEAAEEGAVRATEKSIDRQTARHSPPRARQLRFAVSS